MPERDQRGEVEHEKELPVVTDRKQRLVEVRGEKLAAAEGDEKATFTPIKSLAASTKPRMKSR